MKESLQEATQRALLEGYKNLKENKSKKAESKSSNWKVLDWDRLDDDTIKGVVKYNNELYTFDYNSDIGYIHLVDTSGKLINIEDLNDEDFSNYMQDIEINETDNYDEKTESKKAGIKLEDIQMEIYEMIQTARKVDKQDKDTNKRETAYAIMQEYPEINRKELINYISMKADEIYAGDYDEKTENKKTEAYNYNWKDDIEEVENTEENDELVYAFAENLMNTDPDYADYDDPWEIISNIISIWKINKRSRLYDYLIKWYGSEEEMKKHVRSFYETNDAIYFETGTGYSIFDADLLGGNADGRTADEFGRFVANGGVKEESKKVEGAPNLNKEIGDFNRRLNVAEDYLRSKGFSEEELQELRDDTVLGKSALLDKYDEIMNKSESKKVTERVKNEYYYEIHFKFNEDDEAPEGYSKFFKSSKNVDEDIGKIYDLADAEGGLDWDDDIRDVDYVKKIDKAEYERATRTKTESKKVIESNVSNMTLKKLLTVEKALTDCIMSTNNNELLDIIQPMERNISEYLRSKKVSW